ncbi:MAG: ABC transporter permease [Devosia sp.]
MSDRTLDAPRAAFRLRLPRIELEFVVVFVILLALGFLVLTPLAILMTLSLNTGDPTVFPPETYGVDNYGILGQSFRIVSNTLQVSAFATVTAIMIGFLLAWILTRTRIRGAGVFQRMMELPYYMTPLVGALAWSILAAPNRGFLNQIWNAMGFEGNLINIYSPLGIAWVMALFEGTVAFVMISAAMRSMDPALEESSRVLGASKLTTMLKVTLPLVLPGVLGATLFVFAEMLSAFAAPLVLGSPDRFYVLTTAIWQSTLSFPPNYGRAAAMGVALFVIMAVMLWGYRKIISTRSHATVGGKAFRPRPLEMGRLSWVLLAICVFYVLAAVALPLGALILTSLQSFATVILTQSEFTLANYQQALLMAPVRLALTNSFIVGLGVATIGVVLMALIVWIIYRSRLPGRSFVEYLAMFPQAVPRMVFGLAFLLMVLHLPVNLYGTLWVLGLAYFVVLLPLGVRTLAGVLLQIDKSLDECARVCGASWGYRMRSVTLPLLRPGILATWILIFLASVRELGSSIFLMGPYTKVIGPAIVEAWSSSGTEITATIAIIQMAAVFLAVLVFFALTKRFGRR